MTTPGQPDDPTDPESVDGDLSQEETSGDDQPVHRVVRQPWIPRGLSDLYAASAARKLASAFKSTDYLRAAEQLRANLLRNYDSFQKVAEGATRLFRTVELLPNYQRLLANLTPRLDLPDFAELFRRYEPSNWHDLDDVKTTDLLDLARGGWPVAWVPGATVLRALAASTPEDRAKVLLDYEPQVLDDCESALAEVVDTPEEVQATLLGQAVNAARQGLHAPAQALAAAIIDTLIRNTVSLWQGYRDWLKMQPDDDEFTIGQLRYVATMAPVKPALKEFWTGDPVPAAFNRHASAHAVGDIQYTHLNALVGVLLAVSVTRELHEQHVDGLPN